MFVVINLNVQSFYVVDVIFFGQVLFWVVFGGMLMFFLIYFVGVEEGVMLFVLSNYVYEYVYDVCYFFGFFCY